MDEATRVWDEQTFKLELISSSSFSSLDVCYRGLGQVTLVIEISISMGLYMV